MEVLELLQEERSKLAEQLTAIDRAIDALNGTGVRRSVHRRRTARRITHPRRTMSLAVRKRIGAGVRKAHRQKNGE